MADSDELRLTVSLVDNASAGLKNITGQLVQIKNAGQQTGEANRHVEKTNEAFKKFFETIERAGKYVLPEFAHTVVGGTTSLLAFGLGAAGAGAAIVATAKMVGAAKESFTEFLSEVKKFRELGTITGFDPATIKNIEDAYRRAGRSAEEAVQDIQGAFQTLGESLRLGQTELRDKLLGGIQSPEQREAALKAFIGIGREDITGFLNWAVETGATVRKNAEEMYKQVRPDASLDAIRSAGVAAEEQFLKVLRVSNLIHYDGEKFVAATKEQVAELEENIKLQKELEKLTGSISVHWSHITEQMWSSFAASTKMKDTLEWMDRFLGKWEEKGFLGAAKESAEAEETRKKAAVEAGKPIQEEHKQKSWSDLFKWAFPEKPLVPGFQHGGIVPRDGLAMLHGGETVIPGEGAGAIKDQTKATEELTDEMKKLTSYILYGSVGTQMGGLGPGLGRGPGMIGGGGFGGGGVGGGGFGGGGVGGGGGGQGHRSGGGPPGTGNQGSSDTLNDETGRAVDPDTMKQVEALGRNGDAGGIQKLMQSKGYKMSGPVCGMLAASFAKGAGFTPPPGAAVATNWRKFGEAATAADINAPGHPFGSEFAVEKLGTWGGHQGQPLATGATGGHVMTVVPGSYDPKTKSALFVGQEGVKRRPLSEVDLRQAGVDPAVLAAGAQATGAGAQATGAASDILRSLRGTDLNAAIMEQARKQGLSEDQLKTLSGTDFNQAIATAASMTRTAAARPGQQKAGSKDWSDIYGTVRKWEGFHAAAYADVGGTSIGYGTGAKPGQTITEPAARAAMESALQADRATIEKINPNLSEGSKKALSSLLFNLGGDVSKLHQHGMYQAIVANDPEAMKKAHLEFSHIHGPAGPVLPGLLKRRQDELQYYDQRANIDREMTHRVEGNASLDINVNAPKGTRVGSRLHGLFKKQTINRQTQMEPAASSLVGEEE
jgi:GH24 family phage-related lysozyme (muramidase)